MEPRRITAVAYQVDGLICVGLGPDAPDTEAASNAVRAAVLHAWCRATRRGRRGRRTELVDTVCSADGVTRWYAVR